MQENILFYSISLLFLISELNDYQARAFVIRIKQLFIVIELFLLVVSIA